MIDLKHADGTVFRYVHLDKQSVDLTSVRLGARLPQGLVLGVIKPNTWNDENCGYANQSPGWAHLHWIMPTDRPITIDGWTVTFPTNT
jgi:murein DD-endopeptidase MepM/ murein hydrolase activator NlpD